MREHGASNVRMLAGRGVLTRQYKRRHCGTPYRGSGALCPSAQMPLARDQSAGYSGKPS